MAGKISDYQQEGLGFNSRSIEVLTLGKLLSPHIRSADRNVKALVWSLGVLSGYVKEPTRLSIRVG